MAGSNDGIGFTGGSSGGSSAGAVSAVSTAVSGSLVDVASAGALILLVIVAIAAVGWIRKLIRNSEKPVKKAAGGATAGSSAWQKQLEKEDDSIWGEKESFDGESIWGHGEKD